MRILIFNWRDITHPWAGGAERHIHELAKRWVKKGHKVTLVAGGYSGASKRQNIDGIEIIRTGNTYTIFFISPLYYLFKLRKKKYDCIIDTAHGIPFFLPLVSRRPVILVVHHDHKKLWETEFGMILSKLGIFVEKKVVPIIYRHSLVITLSATEKKAIKRFGFRKIYAITPGTDNIFFKPNTKKSKKPTILYLGRLRKYKRVDFLIDLFPEIRREIRDVQLIIAGDGQDKSRIKDLIKKKGLRDEILLKGYISDEEKINLLSSSWVFAFPSLMEGWGLVAMEAAACGTPTVGFNVPGVSDAVSDNLSGFLVKTKKEFSDSLIKILRKKSMRLRLSRGARSWARKFSWEKSSIDFMKIIKKAINDKR